MRAMSGIEDVCERPEDYGFCSFEDFRKNKERWKGRPDDEVTAIDRGDKTLNCLQRYYMDTGGSGRHRLESLEHGERIAKEMGLDFYKDFLVKPQLRQDSSLRRGFYNEVTFVPKRRFAR